jgi:hydroxymethylpyrimidine/phosphomethylpyrimidine kinase
MPSTPVVVLSIAGFDPSSGAGVTADVKTAAAHGCYAVACITALTVQTTQGVRRIEPVSTALVNETLEELVTDFSIAAVRIGMLGSAAVGRAVADFLRRSALPNVVLDPIYRSSSGTSLLDTAGADLLKRDLLKLADVVTPNLEEAAALTGLKVTNLAEMKIAAGRLHEVGARNVVVTGGHLEKPTDVLTFTTPGGRIEQQIFTSERHPSRSTHGTGCAFATSVACHLAQGRRIPDAVLLAKAYVAAAISNAAPLGKGIGPLDHLFRFNQPQRRAVTVADPELV